MRSRSASKEIYFTYILLRRSRRLFKDLSISFCALIVSHFHLTLAYKPLIPSCIVINVRNYCTQKQPKRINVKWFIAAGGISAALYSGKLVYNQYQIDKAPLHAFQRGHVPATTKDHNAPLIPRTEEIANLCEFIESSGVSGKYVVMLGDHGCGKTTLIEQTCQSEALRKRGCVYISVPEADRGKVKVTDTLAAPFMYKRPRGVLASVIAAITGEIKDPKPVSTELADVLSVIEHGAREYATLTKQLPILVIDNINHLATNDPLALETLQNRAKEWADRRIVTVVFVSSYGAAIPQLKGRSAYSRAAEYFVGGISESAAVAYLCANKKLEKDIAEKVVRELTGDRLHLIVDVATAKTSGYEEIKDSVFQKMSPIMAHLLEEPFVFQKVATQVIAALQSSSSKHISLEKFQHIVALLVPETQRKEVTTFLRCCEIFSVTEKFVSFQSIGMQTYLEHNPFEPVAPASVKLSSVNK